MKRNRLLRKVIRMFGFGLLQLMAWNPKPALASDNGLALTPPMGWNSWNAFGENVSETLIKQMADATVTNGFQAAGYEYINMDDGWQVGRDTNGVILADPARFPGGIKALADYVHAKGLKLGLSLGSRHSNLRWSPRLVRLRSSGCQHVC